MDCVQTHFARAGANPRETGYSRSQCGGGDGLDLFPSSVKFEDGTTWLPQSEGECFHVFWRDPTHPDLPVLPPRQIEMNPD